jgi:hypothetical protein
VLTATEPKAEQPTWKLEQEVDGEGPLHPINVVACPSMKLCLAGDGEGKVLSSQNPGAGAGEEATWTPKRVDSGQSITGVSCPSSELCVAVDDAGNVLSTTEPAKGAEAVWTEPKSIDAGHAITGVSCPSSELCVAVDHSGNVLSTSEPTKGEEAKWTGPAEVDQSKTSGVASLAGVSCASSTLCLANDTSGNVVSSIEPTNPESWKVTEGVEYGNPITALSCPSSALCVAGDRLGHIALGTPQLSVTVSGSGHGTVEGPGNLSCTARCTKRYEGGQAVTLTATPANGSTFAGWGGACSGTASTCTVTMGAALEVTAEFTASPQAELTPGLTSPAFGCCNFTGPAREVKPLAGTLLGNPSASAKGVSLTLSCQGSAGQSCDYTALLTTTEHLKGNKVSAISAAKRKQASTKILTVGKATFAVAAGQQKTILIKLSRAASQLLARFHKLPLTLTVTLTNGAGGKSSTVAKRTLLVKTKSKAKPKSKHR